MGLNRAELLTAGRLKTEALALDDGSEVLVSELGAIDCGKLYAVPEYQDNGTVNMELFGPALLVRCLVDNDGNRLFSDGEADLVARLRGDVYQKLLRCALVINGLAGDIQEAEIKN